MEQEAKIFLSEERGITESLWLRSYNTFNFGNHQCKYKNPVDQLYVLNEDTLAPGKSIRMNVEEDSLLVLLPVAGAVDYSDNSGNVHTIVAGEILQTALQAKNYFSLTNPYPDALINYLQIWIRIPGLPISITAKEQSFDITANKDNLIKIPLSADISLYIGKFGGRQKATISFKNNTPTCFAFVIEGAVELEERLLHAGDGLAIWKTTCIEMEALSNDAIILVLEMPEKNLH